MSLLTLIPVSSGLRPITWGDVKSLVSAAQQQLLRNHQEPTPDNLLLAVFAHSPSNGSSSPPP
uniref:Uncharacterized protein n=1 Tax=Pelusios castaneus TaxID=367368 RepID=A0A8C8VM43_9SAUR